MISLFDNYLDRSIVYLQFSYIYKNVNNFRYYFTSLKRGYSVFPSNYVRPVYSKEEQETLFQSDEAKKILHERVKPALVTDTCSEFYDKRVL